MNKISAIISGGVFILTIFITSDISAKAMPGGQAQLQKGDKLIVLPSIEKGTTTKSISKAEYQRIFPPYWPARKFYSIYGNEFDSYHEKISWSSQGGLTNRYVSQCNIAVCGLAAPIHVPDKTKITGYDCKVVDNSTTHPVKLVLFWTKGDGFSYSLSSCMSGTSVSSATSNIRSVTNTTCSVPVDNSKFAYGIKFHTYNGSGTSATTCGNGGKNCRIYNCTINYQ